MQPVPTYEDLPVVFSAAPQVEIPDPTIDTGYGEGVALPTEHFSWLEYKVTQKIDELATSTLSLLGEMDSYLTSRGVTPSGASVTQFQTALAAQIAGASVASAAACTGNSATATTATNALACSGNAATATISAACSGNAATATISAACSGNAATATTATNALACSGNSSTATTSSKVAGIDPVNGNAGIFSDSFIGINPGSSYIIPKGTYVFSGYNNSATGAGLQILNTAGNTWYPNAGNNTTLQGMIISDGINYRIYNWSSNTVLLFYRKLA